MPEQELTLAVAIASPQKDQPTARTLLQAQLPVRGEGTSIRGGFDPCRSLLTHRLHMPVGTLLQLL